MKQHLRHSPQDQTGATMNEYGLDAILVAATATRTRPGREAASRRKPPKLGGSEGVDGPSSPPDNGGMRYGHP